MKQQLRKLIRTVQSEFYYLKDARDIFYLHSRRLLAQPHEVEFRALKFIPNSLAGVYIDIGANQGQSIESIKVMKPSARVQSFEPNPGLAKRLQDRYKDRDDVTVFSYGLSDVVESRTLFVPAYRKFVYDGNASFDREGAACLYNADQLFWYSSSKLELREVSCSLQRLDDQNLDPLFIKIDVQGFEHRVVTGGIETLKRCEPILMVECLYDHGELVEILDSLGYEEFVFDELGFYKGKSSGAINQLVMTERRSREVKLSPRASFGEGAQLEAMHGSARAG